MYTEEYTDRGAALWLSTGKFDDDMTHALFGMQTETAEVTDLFKKSWFTPKRGTTVDKERITDELGDILYYLTRIADLYQVTLDEIMEYNIKKLEKRYGPRSTT